MVELFLCGFVEAKRWQDFRKPGSQGEPGSFLGFESSLKGVKNGYPGGIFDPLGLTKCVLGAVCVGLAALVLCFVPPGLRRGGSSVGRLQAGAAAAGRGAYSHSKKPARTRTSLPATNRCLAPAPPPPQGVAREDSRPGGEGAAQRSPGHGGVCRLPRAARRHRQGPGRQPDRPPQVAGDHHHLGQRRQARTAPLRGVVGQAGTRGTCPEGLSLRGAPGADMGQSFRPRSAR